jgi:hypothetical protein
MLRYLYPLALTAAAFPSLTYAQVSPTATEIKESKDNNRILALLNKKTPMGVRYRILNDGDVRKPKQNHVVLAQINLSTLDGKFTEKTEGIFYVDKLIPGMTDLITSLSINSRAVAIIPFNLAYGTEIFGEIPANSDLLVEINIIADAPQAVVERNIPKIQQENCGSGVITRGFGYDNNVATNYSTFCPVNWISNMFDALGVKYRFEKMQSILGHNYCSKLSYTVLDREIHIGSYCMENSTSQVKSLNFIKQKWETCKRDDGSCYGWKSF